MQFFETSAKSNVNVEVAFMTIARDVMHRFVFAPHQLQRTLADAIGAVLGGEFVAELMAQSSYCLASQSSLQRWEAMFRCRAPSQAFAPQWHVLGIDVGLKQRSTLFTRAALCELLVLRLMRFQGAYHVTHPLRHVTCVVSRRHFFFSKNRTDGCLSLISLSVVNELRDIFLCSLSSLGDPTVIAAAEQRIANGLQPMPLAMLSLVPYSCSNWKIHWIQFVHQCIRRYAILPVLIMAIPMLIVVQGSSGVSICLNSVGVLFILEMDNLAYQYGIHEQDREKMETEGSIYLSGGVQASLVRMKNGHLISVPLGITVTLLLIRADITGPYHLQIVWMLVCSLSFWACGLVETIIFTKDEAKSMMLKLVSFEVFKMVIGEMAIWLALCLLYPFFIPSFFTGSFF